MGYQEEDPDKIRISLNTLIWIIIAIGALFCVAGIMGVRV